MKRGLPGHVPMLRVDMEPGEARVALLLLQACALEREGNEVPVPEDLHGAIVALEEALGMTAADIMRSAS